MTTDSDRYYQKELEKIEREQNNLRNKYYSDENQIELEKYTRIVSGNTRFNLTGKTPSQALTELEIFARMATEKNHKTHVTNGKRPWHTHTNKMGCFMCEDLEFIYFLKSLVYVICQYLPKDYHFP